VFNLSEKIFRWHVQHMHVWQHCIPPRGLKRGFGRRREIISELGGGRAPRYAYPDGNKISLERE
jgi:hypothetical protein